MIFSLTYHLYGERSILVEWPTEISEHILRDILDFKEKIVKTNNKRIVELKTAYNSLLVVYDRFNVCFEDELSVLKRIYSNKEISIAFESRLWKIPVCYDISFGIDLDGISDEKNLSRDDIINRHSKAIYTVYFIGFLPGFLYLGGLDETLFTPRKITPRLKIEKGSVAIGGNQTGIYPQESPGGWNIIGNSPINFFDTSKENPCFARAGDKLQFYSISLKEYQNIEAMVGAKEYKVESEVLSG